MRFERMDKKEDRVLTAKEKLWLSLDGATDYEEASDKSDDTLDLLAALRRHHPEKEDPHCYHRAGRDDQ